MQVESDGFNVKTNMQFIAVHAPLQESSSILRRFASSLGEKVDMQVESSTQLIKQIGACPPHSNSHIASDT